MNERFQIRVPLRDIYPGAPVEYAQTWEVKVYVPLADLGDVGIALHARFDDMQIGDKVTIASYGPQDRQRISHIAEYRVVDKDRYLDVRPFGDTFFFKNREAADEEDERISGRLKVEKVNGQFQVVDENGTLVESFPEEQQAKDLKERLDPTPEFRPKRGWKNEWSVIDRAGKPVVTGLKSQDMARDWIKRNKTG